MQANVTDRMVIKKIADFIKSNKVATICCADEIAAPYCFNCFYVFQEETQLLFFKSSANSFHARLLAKNPKIAGTILPAKLDLLSLKGIQFSGEVLCEATGEIQPWDIYHKSMPFAIAKPGHVWCIALKRIKMTDNTLIFGKKLEWNRSE
jgi:uncharacterized protein